MSSVHDFHIIKAIPLIAFSTILFSLYLSSSFIYARTQGGPASIGTDTGGAAVSGGITANGTCSLCTSTNLSQAIGGQTDIGTSTSENTISSRAATNVSLLVDKGNALVGLGRYKQAMQNFDKALAIDPNNKYVLFNKGNALLNQGNYSHAIQYLDKVSTINFKEKLDNIGVALASQGYYPQAVQYFDKALAIEPNDKSTLANKAAVLSKMQNSSP